MPALARPIPELTRYWPVEVVSLHPSTDPEFLFGEWCREVSQLVRQLDSTDATELSKLLCLPVWNVQRCLAHLGLGEMPEPAIRTGGTPRVRLYDLIVQVMSDGVERAAKEIAGALGKDASVVYGSLRDHPEKFESRKVMAETRGWVIMWKLRKPQTKEKP